MTLKLRTELLKTSNAFKNIENVIPLGERNLHTIQKKAISKKKLVKRKVAARKSEGQSDERQHGAGGAETVQSVLTKMDSRMPVLPRATETTSTVMDKAVERKMPALIRQTVETVQPVIPKEKKQAGLRLSDNLSSEGVKVVCSICDKPQTLSCFSDHLKDSHHFPSLTVYENLYGRFYNHIKPEQRTYHECKLCGDFVLLDMSEIGTHLKAANHPIKNSEYINKYCKTKRRGTKRQAKKVQNEPEPKIAKVNTEAVPQSTSSKHIIKSSDNNPCQTSRNVSKNLTLEEKVSAESTDLSLTHTTESTVKKSTVLEKLHHFDLDEILRKILTENPRSYSACDLLKAWEIILNS